MAFLDRFRLVVLDMHGTFMFGADRYGPAEDYAATYRAIGGPPLDTAIIQAVLPALKQALDEPYHDPARQDDHPSVAEVLATLAEADALDASRREAVELVLAQHEMGQVPDDYVPALKALAARYRLGLISNLWSLPCPWLAQLADKGLDDIFEVMLFSSETRSIKPSPRLFQILLERAAVAPAEAVYIGDDPYRDVLGARSAGMATVWLSHGRTWNPADGPPADREAHSLLQLDALVD